MDAFNDDATVDNWGIPNNPDWLANAFALDDLVVAASEDAATTRCGSAPLLSRSNNIGSELNGQSCHTFAPTYQSEVPTEPSVSGRCCDHVCQGMLAGAQGVETGPSINADSQPTPTSSATGNPTENHTDVTGNNVVVCPNVNSIRPGRQTAKVLKCGIVGCTYTKLFARKYELERHMKTHEAGAFPCSVEGCERMLKAFTRPDKLREHMGKAHGV